MQTIEIDITDFKTLCERRGHNFDSAKACIVGTLGDIAQVDASHPSYPNPPEAINVVVQRQRISDRGRNAISNIGDGPGTELKKILSWFNITATENCSCNKRAKYMNDMGAEWCRNNQDLICSWLKEEASNRKLPFLPYLAKKAVLLAIKRAEKNVY
jgi:hypothetical protein